MVPCDINFKKSKKINIIFLLADYSNDLWFGGLCSTAENFSINFTGHNSIQQQKVFLLFTYTFCKVV